MNEVEQLSDSDMSTKILMTQRSAKLSWTFVCKFIVRRDMS